MKIGFSFGLCLADILTGKVREDDVVCIIARTWMDREHLGHVIQGYISQGRIRISDGVDYQSALVLAERLWDKGKIHQPSQFGPEGSNRHVGVSRDMTWMDLTPTKISDNENVRKAWDNYQLMLKMCEGKGPDTEKARMEVLGLNGNAPGFL